MVPADLKEQLADDIEKGFILRPRGKSDSDRCLELYTKADWDELMNRMRLNMKRNDEQQRLAIMRFNDGAKYIKIDSNGRLQIPKELMDKVAFDKEVVITQELVNMVIWDKDLYQKRLVGMDDQLYESILDDLMK